MSNKELAEKEAYFRAQELLDLSDDETGFPDAAFLEAKKVFEATPASMGPPPAPASVQRGSFLGPTPKELQAEFERNAQKHRGEARKCLVRSVTAPEPETSSSFPVAVAKRNGGIQGRSNSGGNSRAGLLKHSVSLPELQPETEFYKRVGDVPRPLSKAKKDAVIKLEPASMQLLKRKIIYFYPNDDVSSARRMKIHKCIQLGAAWVKTWRSDITHVMVEDRSYKYSQLLNHLQMESLPAHIIVVKFDPYVPQCIMFRKLLDPTEKRFLVEGAPQSARNIVNTASLLSTAQSSPQIKEAISKKRRLAQDSQISESRASEDSPPPAKRTALGPVADDSRDIVKDSFVFPSDTQQASASHQDALSEAILQARAISYLPLDEESDDGSTRSSNTASLGGPALKTNAAGVKVFNQNAFQCMNPSSGKYANNPNARTIEVLQEMAKYYDQMQDQWRTLAYRKAITTLSKQTRKITTKEEALALPNIGTHLAEKIEEIVLTNRLQRLESTRDDPIDQCLRLFLGIYGVGLSQANKWIQVGHRSLEDLTKKAKLSDSQKFGILRYNDFNARIPRKEVEQHGAYVQRALRKIDALCEATIMGSYRRGAKDSGDIDLIISKPGTSISDLRSIVLGKLVPNLFKAGFLKVTLATSHHSDGTKWHGASCLPFTDTWRRLDLLLVPEGEMGAALIYFTGNDIFNRSMRLLASKKGMRLNQKGLYKDVARGRNREKQSEGTLLEGRDENKIFEILGVPWRAPNERIC